MNANLVRKLNQYFVHLNAVKYSSDQTQPSRKLTPQQTLFPFWVYSDLFPGLLK